MQNNKKFILQVVFGEQASDYAAERGFAAAKKRIESGRLEGCVSEYAFDTEADRLKAIEMLEDSDGWMGAFWQKKTVTIKQNQNPISHA